jgi:hypothetical protein
MSSTDFPSALLSLSDSQLATIMAAAHPMRPAAQSQFFEAVAVARSSRCCSGKSWRSPALPELLRRWPARCARQVGQWQALHGRRNSGSQPRRFALLQVVGGARNRGRLQGADHARRVNARFGPISRARFAPSGSVAEILISARFAHKEAHSLKSAEGVQGFGIGLPPLPEFRISWLNGRPIPPLPTFRRRPCERQRTARADVVRYALIVLGKPQDRRNPGAGAEKGVGEIATPPPVADDLAADAQDGIMRKTSRFASYRPQTTRPQRGWRAATRRHPPPQGAVGKGRSVTKIWSCAVGALGGKMAWQTTIGRLA